VICGLSGRSVGKRLPLTVFGVGFAAAGLASAWTAAVDHDVAPPIVADVLWGAAAAVLAVTLYEYGRRVGGIRLALADVREPVRGMYSVLVPALLLLLGARLARELPLAGYVLIAVAAVVAFVFGLWFTIRLVLNLLSGTSGFRAWHGGYLLPTASAPLIVSQVFATGDGAWLARLALIIGLSWWVVVVSVLAARLVVGLTLPVELRMTLAIAASPPAMAGNAWFALNTGVDDAQIWLLAMVVAAGLMQVALVPQYARAQFGLGWWGVAFAVTANATYVVHWLCAARPAGWRAEAVMSLLVATLAVGIIAVRSLVRPRPTVTGSYLPR
jgi:tellurite resistance protein